MKDAVGCEIRYILAYTKISISESETDLIRDLSLIQICVRLNSYTGERSELKYLSRNWKRK